MTISNTPERTLVGISVNHEKDTTLNDFFQIFLTDKELKTLNSILGDVELRAKKREYALVEGDMHS
jgi:hypothetical protein